MIRVIEEIFKNSGYVSCDEIRRDIFGEKSLSQVFINSNDEMYFVIPEDLDGKVLQRIVKRCADVERNETLDAVENISAIIQQTASSSSLVRDLASELLNNVEKLSQTAEVLDDNMNGLKTEINAFTIE